MSRPYLHLDLEERRKIAHWHEAKVPATLIAARLGRHRSTIFREVKRNWWHDKDVPQADGWHVTVQSQADSRRSRRRKLERLADLRAEVIRCLQDG